jgi:hypothetical protein
LSRSAQGARSGSRTAGLDWERFRRGPVPASVVYVPTGGLGARSNAGSRVYQAWTLQAGEANIGRRGMHLGVWV